jgi:C4-dicarboxylate-specific signal transduction histidine kinase
VDLDHLIEDGVHRGRWVDSTCRLPQSEPTIGPDADPKLFKPFFTTKRRGTGLGLASSRAIIEAHEGTIGFENLRLGGARFWFRLPVVSA